MIVSAAAAGSGPPAITAKAAVWMDADLALGTWHWLFHLQPDLPELIEIGAYVRHMIEQWAHIPLPAEDVDEYVRAFRATGAARAGFADYRAALPVDAEHDEADAG